MVDVKKIREKIVDERIKGLGDGDAAELIQFLDDESSKIITPTLMFLQSIKVLFKDDKNFGMDLNTQFVGSLIVNLYPDDDDMYKFVNELKDYLQRIEKDQRSLDNG